MRSTTEIGDLIGKIRGDGKEEAVSTMAVSSESHPLNLTTLHPADPSSKTLLGVVANHILRLRDKYYNGDKRISAKVKELGGVISDVNSNHFHLAFENHGKPFSWSIYENCIEFSSQMWFIKMNVIFPTEDNNQIHVFPLVNKETGINWSYITWDTTNNWLACKSDMPSSGLNNLLIYMSSIEYHLDLTKEPADIESWLIKDF